MMTIDFNSTSREQSSARMHQICEYYWFGFVNRFHHQFSIIESIFKMLEMPGCATIHSKIAGREMAGGEG
jgi:hypothetical protein